MQKLPMFIRRIMQRSPHIVHTSAATIATMALAFFVIAGQAADAVPVSNEAGIRYERAVQHFPGLVREELFLRLPFQWQHDFSKNYVLRSYFELAAGDMGRDHHDPTVISVGAQLRLDPINSDRHIYYFVGFSPTLLANTTFGRTTMGTSLEFTSRLGMGIYLGTQRKMALEFSLSHTSNGGLSKNNPGVNTLGMAAVYRFQ